MFSMLRFSFIGMFFVVSSHQFRHSILLSYWLLLCPRFNTDNTMQLTALFYIVCNLHFSFSIRSHAQCTCNLIVWQSFYTFHCQKWGKIILLLCCFCFFFRSSHSNKISLVKDETRVKCIVALYRWPFYWIESFDFGFIPFGVVLLTCQLPLPTYFMNINLQFSQSNPIIVSLLEAARCFILYLFLTHKNTRSLRSCEKIRLCWRTMTRP